MKKYEVAIILDTNGNVVGALKCKMVDEKEYKELINKAAETNALKEQRIKDLELALNNTDKSIQYLAKEIRVLKGEE